MAEQAGERCPDPAARRLCVVAPTRLSISETFIRDHVERLPTEVVLVEGWPPLMGTGPVLSRRRRAWYKLGRLVLGQSMDRELRAGYARAFRQGKIEAVLAEYGPTGVATLAACRSLGLPLLVHFHGYDASVRSVLEQNAEGYRALFKEAAAVIAVSRAMERKLIALGASPERVHYNPCGIDCSAFAGAQPAQAPPVFLAVGRLVEKKGPLLTLRAFQAVHRKAPTAKLRIIGDGPLWVDCVRLAQELGLGDAVAFLKARPHADVQREMRQARCFVQHSLEATSGDCEGTPVAILEAGASGLPVVSTRHAGIPDVVMEGETGLLVDEGDVDTMSREMLRLAERPEIAARMGEAARRRVQALFSRERSLGRLWRIIERCMATPVPRQDQPGFR